MNTDQATYLEILNFFVDEESYRDWMKTPFTSNGKSIATNGVSLVATPLVDGLTDIPDRVKKVYPMQVNTDKQIPLSELKSKFALFPVVECTEDEWVKCDACDGYGEVTFTFDHKGKTYEIEKDCPVCDVKGVVPKAPSGKTEPDPSKYFQIGNSLFRPVRITEIIFVAEKLQHTDIRIINQTTPDNASLFAIGNVEILVMSCDSSQVEKDDIIQKIE